ncbi:MAG: molybdopterin converting factor subunit 1 [Pseudomonadota bacterium]
MKLDIRYFAWLRERIGTASETIDTEATTVAALIEDLKSRGDAHAFALSDLSSIRAAVDQELVDFTAPLADAREVAFFPPMTGG